MDEKRDRLSESTHHVLGNLGGPQSIDWYAPGQTRVFEVEGVQIVVRFVGRKGRRGRIAIVATPEASGPFPGRRLDGYAEG